MTPKYIAYANIKGDVAEVLNVYDPAWNNIENYIPEGIFYDGEVPEPETPDGYVYRRMVKLAGEGAPFIFYTYEPMPPSPETEMERIYRELEETKHAIADLNEAVTEIILGGE